MKSCFLENGSKLSQPVKINRKTYFVQSTCTFDSVAQILLSGAVDHPTYDSAIKKSSNTMLQFVSQTLNTGVIRKTYTDRARLLLNWYTPQPNVKTENNVLSYTLSGYDSIYNFVDKALRTEPSVYITEECSRLCKRQYTSVLMSPNHKIIAKTGFGALKVALNFWPRLTKLRCFTKDCNASMTRTSRLGIHLFIDMDVRNNPSDKYGMRCKLFDIPVSLNFKDVEGNDVQYRLIGAIKFTPGHFTAYSFRNTTNWEHYDDMEINKTLQSAAMEIEPHLVIYVRLP
ncbi:uncharacterized protein [Venturia canescens]|uniref:uncharacterized protein n=1 Tax=Venturia canescens TaxID=32260 RepID=UPI001C9CC2DD|nr:uncharacterized protein LOC122417813 [Venturia canescens]